MESVASLPTFSLVTIQDYVSPPQSPRKLLQYFLAYSCCSSRKLWQSWLLTLHITSLGTGKRDRLSKCSSQF